MWIWPYLHRHRITTTLRAGVLPILIKYTPAAGTSKHNWVTIVGANLKANSAITTPVKSEYTEIIAIIIFYHIFYSHFPTKTTFFIATLDSQ